MTQPYDRFAGQNLAAAMAAIRSEGLQGPVGYAYESGAPVDVTIEREWDVIRSAPREPWVIGPAALQQPTEWAGKKPWSKGLTNFVATLMVLVVVGAIVGVGYWTFHDRTPDYRIQSTENVADTTAYVIYVHEWQTSDKDVQADLKLVAEDLYKKANYQDVVFQVKCESTGLYLAGATYAGAWDGGDASWKRGATCP